MPESEMTATSLVPPPMSTTMLPPGFVTGRPAPMAAIIACSTRYGRTGATGGHHRLLHQVNFSGLGTVGRICHGAVFHLRDLGRDADDDAGMHECPALLRLLDEVVKHLLGHFEVGDHAVFHGLDNPEIAGRTAQHLLSFLADRLDFAGTVVESNGRGLVDTEALVPGLDPRVHRTQVNGKVPKE